MFPDEKACRRYLVEVRWGGRPRCGKCDHDRIWKLRNGRFECRQCGHQTSVTTDSLRSYSQRAVAPRNHHRVNLKQLEDVKIEDPLQQCHRVANLLKRWLLGTYHGSASRKHLAAYLDEDAFRFNRRKIRGVGRIAARLIQQVVAVRPITYRTIVHSPVTP